MKKLFVKSFLLFYIIQLILWYFVENEWAFIKTLIVAILFALSFSFIMTKFSKKKKDNNA